MPSALRSPKTLSSWLELDYPNRRRLFGRWWRLGPVAAAVAAVLALAAMALAGGHRAFQAGPVSAPHAMFNSDCRLCHDGDFSTLARLWGGQGTSVPDSKCTACHAGSHHNPPHAPMGRCVDCHKEHRGHEALVRVDDRRCVRCHQDLKRDDGTETPFATKVTTFTESGHPPFRFFRGNEARHPDPGTIKFNHAVHLAERGVLDFDPGRPGQRKFTRLACDDCHQPDGEGRMKPIRYDAHCARCHPLQVPALAAGKGDEGRRLAALFTGRRLPHPQKGQSYRLVRAALRDQLTRFITGPSGHLFLEGDAPVERPLPGRHPLPGEGPALSEKAFTWVNRQVAEGSHVVYFGAGGCGHCHTVHADRLGEPVIDPPQIKDRWWDHATFSHRPHRMLDCNECHAAKASSQTSDVLLPDRGTCLKCHTKGANASARGDCVECHAYHDPAAQRAARQKGGPLRLEQIKP